MEKLALIALLTLLAIPLHAADVSDLTYDASGPTITITDCDKAASGELIIPASIEGKPVTSIEEAIFQNCDGLTSITIPDSVTSIGKYAFYENAGLTSVTIGNGVTSIGERAFAYCSRLESITIGNGVTSIEEQAFSECTSLTSITIPDSVTSIGERAFSKYHKLTSITIPDSVTTIGEAIFQYCFNLTSITIPDSVTSIGKYAFSRCTSLTSITIPDGVTSVGYGAFYMCSSLTSITFRGNAPTLDDDVFLEAPANAKVFIYEGASGFSPEDGKFGGFSVVVQKKPVPPKIISVVGAGGMIPMSSLIITFTSGIGSNYAIERSRDLVNWVTLLIIAGEESSTEFTDNEPINDGGGVFYRIREGQ